MTFENADISPPAQCASVNYASVTGSALSATVSAAMQLFCPDCQLAFAGTQNCPKCGMRLLAPQESFIDGALSDEPLLIPDPVRSTFLGRVLIGSICSLGFFLAFRELGLAILGPKALDVVALCLLRFFAVAAGSLLTGAGRANGTQPGLVVGLFVGTLLTANDVVLSGGPEFWWPIGLAAGYPVVAGTGGWIGSRIWPAPVELPNVAAASAVTASRASFFSRLGDNPEPRRGERPTVWLRVLLGALIAFAAVVATDQIRLVLAKASIGLFNTGGASRAAAVGAQLAAIILVIGGMIAGANTGAGLRHGFFAALLTIANVFISSIARGNPTDPPVAGLFAYLDIPFVSLLDPECGGIVSATVLVLVTAGGWLGGQLFPPLAPVWMRTRHLPTLT